MDIILNSMLKTLLTLFAAWAFDACALNLLPTVYITTADSTPVNSRDFWRENTQMRIVSHDGKTLYLCESMKIRARGHSTFSKPKKPFTLLLPKPARVLGMAESDHWFLLANFMDHSNVRNSLALAIAQQTSLDWTPSGRMVDVVINGRLQGLYLLCEAVDVGRTRLNVRGEDGFLVEADAYFGSKYKFRTPRKQLPMNVHWPKAPTQKQMQAMQALFERIENALYQPDYGSLADIFKRDLDARSFVDWWLVHELAQNAEPNGPRSCYMHRDGKGRLKAGPVWDFDLAFINVGVDKGGDIRPERLNRTDVVRLTGDSLYNKNALWYARLMQDEGYRALLKKRWQHLKPRFEALVGEIDLWKLLILPSALADEQLWKGQDPARFDIHTGFVESIDNLKAVYQHRIEALDALISAL